MKRIISIIAILIGLLSIIFLLLNLDNVNKEYTYIKELEFKVNNMEKYYKDSIDSLYQLRIDYDSLNNKLKQQEWAIKVTNEECLRLRKQNIQYRLQLK